MSVGSTALRAGHALGEVVHPCCGVSQLEGPDKPADNCHACKHCGHTWELDTVCTVNPLVSLRPYLSDSGAMVFELAREWECVSASKFVKIAAVSLVYLALVEQVGDLNFPHRSAHSGQAHEAHFKGSQELLHELKTAHP